MCLQLHLLSASETLSFCCFYFATITLLPLSAQIPVSNVQETMDVQLEVSSTADGLSLLLPELIHSTPVIAPVIHAAPLPCHDQGLKDGWLRGGALVFWKFRHASTPECFLHQ